MTVDLMLKHYDLLKSTVFSIIIYRLINNHKSYIYFVYKRGKL